MLEGSGGVVVGRSRLNRVCRLHKFEYERSWAWRSYYVSTLEFMPLSVRPFDFSSSTDKHELPAQHSTWLRTYFHYNFDCKEDAVIAGVVRLRSVCDAPSQNAWSALGRGGIEKQ